MLVVDLNASSNAVDEEHTSGRGALLAQYGEKELSSADMRIAEFLVTQFTSLDLLTVAAQALLLFTLKNDELNTFARLVEASLCFSLEVKEEAHRREDGSP